MANMDSDYDVIEHVEEVEQKLKNALEENEKMKMEHKERMEVKAKMLFKMLDELQELKAENKKLKAENEELKVEAKEASEREERLKEHIGLVEMDCRTKEKKLDGALDSNSDVAHRFCEVYYAHGGLEEKLKSLNNTILAQGDQLRWKKANKERPVDFFCETIIYLTAFPPATVPKMYQFLIGTWSLQKSKGRVPEQFKTIAYAYNQKTNELWRKLGDQQFQSIQEQVAIIDDSKMAIMIDRRRPWVFLEVFRLESEDMVQKLADNGKIVWEAEYRMQSRCFGF